ncbi:uncharacterized protein Z518_02738 [Rhinocladiella mackenziei CBS 650.93]|uniref:Nucleoside phosphorylase domain-containing protein n=1 Tax=Rhinocladiella mackenziei CBS 650.93 TaxID=1442369 RepID=A0A0D2HCC3_9EURO|nr:uncharacterized protein Z518_02738 [Rhinocladiella mackenziei CBS 650.93]KIX08083.1 hypothetical protein Z518_02738 [Rhinocladiella mackenziei CBS 650.93]
MSEIQKATVSSVPTNHPLGDHMQTPSHGSPPAEAYTIGWICALQEEYQAACRMLDKEFVGPDELGANDNTIYVFGRIGGHNVVIGCLPTGCIGNSNAAGVANDMVRSFPSLKCALLVGIGGAAPTKKRDIRLGDVVVGVPDGQQPGVVQYDFGKRLPNGNFERTGHLNAPPSVLLGVIQEVRRPYDDPRKPDRISEHMKRMDDMPDYQCPGQDRLYRADYEHRGPLNDEESDQEEEESCKNCGSDGLVQRPARKSLRNVTVHYGTIASGNAVVRDAKMRDRYAKDRELRVLCFEMEAAGLVNKLPCLVIRGICDYSDSHKNDDWHKYAALAATAYARELLNRPQTAKGVFHAVMGETVLEPCDFESINNEYRLKFTPGTCQWIEQEREFQEWGAEKNLLWIFGSGKSFTAHYIREHLKRKNDFLMHFFFDSKSAEVKGLWSLRVFYQTILHQLLLQLIDRNRDTSEKLKAECLEIVRYEETRLGDLKGARSKVAMRQILAKVGPTFLVVDALDECPDSDPDVLRDWLGELNGLPHLRTVITSRPEQRIRDAAEIGLHINLELNSLVHKSNEDIRLFIRTRLQNSKDLQGSGSAWEKVKARIEEELMAKSNGMILYARLMLDILENKAADDVDIVRELDFLPTKPGKVYEVVLNKIDDRKFAQRIFQWLVTCRRPLTVDGLWEVHTLRNAIQRKQSFELQPRDIQPGTDRSRFRRFLLKGGLPLIEILQDDTVRLVHTTVTQFLLGQHSEDDSSVECPLPFRVQLVESHAEVALTCLTYLRVSLGRNDDRDSESLSSDDLYDYAVREWPAHTAESEEQIMRKEKERKVIISFCEEQAFQLWLEARASVDSRFGVQFSLESAVVCYPTPLHIAVHFNLWHVGLRFLIAINARDAAGCTPLHIAAGQDSPRIVQELLSKGARTDIPDTHGSYPIHKAVQRGRTAALRELLGRGQGDIDVQDKYGFTPLHIACQLGWIGCVEVLLEHHATIQIETNAIETLLGLAIANGHSDVVQALLSRDRSLIAHCGKPLVQAARRRRNEMVKFLCEAGADMSHSDFLGQTALHRACISGNKDLVGYLLNNPKVDVDPIDRSQRTPPYFAAEKGYLDIVELLIAHRANLNSLDRRWETALFKPAGNGHTKVVQMLLAAGIDAMKLDMWKRTPMRFAAMKGRRPDVA